MVMSVGIKLPKKEKKRDPLFNDEKHVGSEPVWDPERAAKFEDPEFDSVLQASFRYYNYFFNQKDLKKHVVQWVKEHTKLTKKQQELYAASSPDLTPMTACSIIKAATVGMPMRPRHTEYVLNSVLSAIATMQAAAPVKAKAKGKKDVYVPTIQERLSEKTAEIIGEIEAQVDNAFMNKPVAFKVYDFLTVKNVAQSQVGKIRSVFQRQIDELTEFVEGKDKQLNEAYAFLKKADLKRIGDFYVKLMADLDAYVQVKKATKVARVKKPVSKEKLVAKVKYLKEDKTLKLVSVPPLSIIGAIEVWVYSTKYRKMGHYVADSHSGTLGIKGTSIVGFDPGKSVAKTLRKPDETLKAFMKAGKVELRKFMSGIKSVETKLNGRLNEDILILKVG